MIRCRGRPTHVTPTYEVIKMKLLIVSTAPRQFRVRADSLARAIARQNSIFTYFQSNLTTQINNFSIVCEKMTHSEISKIWNVDVSCAIDSSDSDLSVGDHTVIVGRIMSHLWRLKVTFSTGTVEISILIEISTVPVENVTFSLQR